MHIKSKKAIERNVLIAFRLQSEFGLKNEGAAMDAAVAVLIAFRLQSEFGRRLYERQ